MEGNNMELKDLNLSGASVVTGGEYRNVRVAGASKISSDIICETMDISGAITVQGNVTAKTCKVSGACQIDGNISSPEIKISGGSKVKGNLEGKNIKMAGALKVDGAIKGDIVKLSGEISIGGDTECEEFHLSGAVHAKGTLNCERCDLAIYADSEIEELVGGTIKVTKGRGSANTWVTLRSLFAQMSGNLRVRTIEGDDIYLENTTCDMVRGSKVVIGPDCSIGTVEYSEKLDIHASSKVESKVGL